MKLISKINRGFFLIIIAIIAIAIYLFNLSVYQDKEKKIINEVCTNYINKAVSYNMLPEKNIKEKLMLQSDLNTYMDDITKDIKSFYIDNEQSYKQVIEDYKAKLSEQAKGLNIVHSFKKSSLVFNDYKFDGDTVTVKVSSNASYDGPSMEGTGDISGLDGQIFISQNGKELSSISKRESVSAKTEDIITLQKVKGDWKIVSADISLPSKEKNMRIGM